jgi:hypothetical protein
MPALLLLVAALLAAVCAPVSADSEWEFPALDDTYQSVFEHAAMLSGDTPTSITLVGLMEDAPSSSTLLMLNLAGVLSGAEPSRGEDVTATIRRRAEEVRDREWRWGAEPLLFAALNDRGTMTASEVFAFLFDQFLDDQVRGNSYGAAQILLTGIAVWPTEVLPRVEQRWDARVTAGPLDQEGLRLAQLLLCHASGVRHGWAGEVRIAIATDQTESVARLSPWQRVRLADVAASVLVSDPADSEYYLHHDILDPLARMILFEYSGDYLEALALVTAKGKFHDELGEEVYRSLVDHGNVALLASPRFERVLVYVSGEAWTWPRWQLIEALSGGWIGEEEEYEVQPWQKEVHHQRQRYFAVIRRHLESGSRREQLERAEFLLSAGDREVAEEAQELIIASLAGEKNSWWWGNDAWRLRAGASNEIEPTPEMMEAGLAVAVQAEDFTMAGRLVEVMTEWIDGWSPGDNGPLLSLMMENLRDDDIPNNGAAVYRLLYPHRERLAPMLEELRDQEGVDWQVRRAARNLLLGESYLGEATPPQQHTQ